MPPPTDALLAKLAFILVLATAFAVFAYNLYGRMELLLQSTGDAGERFDNIMERVKGIFVFVLGQKRLFDDPVPGLMHALIFWGFCVLTIQTINVLLGGLVPGLHLPLTHNAAFEFMFDLFTVLVLAAVLFAFYRRFVVKPGRLTYSMDAIYILSMIALLMVTDLLYDGTSIAYSVGWPEFGRVAQFAGFLSSQIFFSGSSQDALITINRASWWIHVGTLLFFLNYLPFSKHSHIIAAPINVFFRSVEPKGKLHSIRDLEEREEFGVERVEQFHWKQLLDLFACAESGRCTDQCPAALTGKPLSPKKLIHDLREHMLDVGILPNGNGGAGAAVAENDGDGRANMIRDVVTEQVLWDCTTCRACHEACPVLTTFIDKIVDMRRHLVLMEGDFPAEAQTALRNIEVQSNPWGIGGDARADWAQDLGVKMMAEHPDAEYLYYVGCAGSFDDRNKKIATSFVKILQAAGVDFAILGKEEMCNGETARRIGNEYLFQMMAQTNVELLNGYNVKKILTACPHCFNTLKNEYPEFGGNYEVIHTSVFVAKLIKDGQISLTQPVEQNITYHDSCYMGRHNDHYEEPRTILNALPGATVTEMERSKNRGLCCGAGGGRMWMEETIGDKINHVRSKEAADTGARIVASTCPFCMIMMEEGIGSQNLGEQMVAKDLVELVADAIE